MKIGIITIQKCNNYGADLQAYALGAKLRSMGYDAENIDYLFYKHPRHQGSKLEKPTLPISLKNRIKELLSPIIATLKGLRNRCVSIERRKRFDEWFNANVKVGREYRSVKSLYDDPPKYDVYVTGSDQVWNPRLYSNIKPYFLDFAPQDKRCIAYASSIGVPTISPLVYKTYKKLLARYSAIGVREPTSERIIAGMGLCAPVKTVVDPTLLLTCEEWLAVARQPKDVRPYSYVVEYNLEGKEAIHAFAMRCAKQLSVSLIDITASAYGPGEFLWLFAHARAAVVCSFHGTIFSVMNKVPFYSVYQESAGRNGGRIALFAKSIGLGDRMIPYSRLGSVQLDFIVDFTNAERSLEKIRHDSTEFLRSAIDGRLPRIESRVAPDCYALWVANERVRRESTSGGAFWLLAKQILATGGVVFGAAFDEDFRHVRHRAARTYEEILPLMKSKYVDSDCSAALVEAYNEVKAGNRVLFSGTPCQIAAVKHKCHEYLCNLITVDIVCHGVPRSDIFSKYIGELESEFHEKIVNYEFRNKRYGWNFSKIVFTLESGRKIWRIGEHDPYFSGYSRNVFLRESCYSCLYARLERISDITLADCWRVATSHPQYDDGKGTSLLLVNTEKGRAIWEDVKKSGDCCGGRYDLELARLRNAPLMGPPAKSAFYDRFKNELADSGSFKLATKVYFNKWLRLRGALRYWLKKFGWFYFKHHQ